MTPCFLICTSVWMVEQSLQKDQMGTRSSEVQFCTCYICRIYETSKWYAKQIFESGLECRGEVCLNM